MTIPVAIVPRLPLRIACAVALSWASLACVEAVAGLTVDTGAPPEPPPAAPTPRAPARPVEPKKPRTPPPAAAKLPPHTPATPATAKLQPPAPKTKPAAPQASTAKIQAPAPTATPATVEPPAAPPTAKIQAPPPAKVQPPAASTAKIQTPAAPPPAAKAQPRQPSAANVQPPQPATAKIQAPVTTPPPAKAQPRPAAPAAAHIQPPAATREPGREAQPAAAAAAISKRSLDQYIELLKHEITGAWHPPANKAGADPVVSFTVNRAGSVAAIQVTTSSGDTAMDGQAVKTLQSLSPFDPLPPGTPDTIAIDFTFQHVTMSDQADEGEDEVFRRRRRARKYPTDSKAAYEYGRALRFADRPQEAVDELKRAMDVGYPKGPCLLELAHSYKKLGRQEEAEANFKESIKAAPDIATAYRYLGDLYYEQKRWGEALTEYREFLKLQPSGPVSELANMRIQLCQRRLEGQEEGNE